MKTAKAFKILVFIVLATTMLSCKQASTYGTEIDSTTTTTTNDSMTEVMPDTISTPDNETIIDTIQDDNGILN